MRRALVTALAGCIALVIVATSVAAAGRVTYRPRRGDGCGPPTQDGFAWATFVVREGRLCGSYPWNPQRMTGGGSVAFYNRGRSYHHVVSWHRANSRKWNLDVGVRPNSIVQRQIYRPGLYLFRDPASSRLVRSEGTVKCRGACGYLRVTY